MEKAKETAREKGYAETLMHRRRYLPDITSHNATVRGFAERNAINAPIQGTAADIIKIAMVRIYDRFKRENIRSKMLLRYTTNSTSASTPTKRSAWNASYSRKCRTHIPLTYPSWPTADGAQTGWRHTEGK